MVFFYGIFFKKSLHCLHNYARICFSRLRVGNDPLFRIIKVPFQKRRNFMSKIEEALEELALPICEKFGVYIYETEYKKEGETFYLRLFIDKEGGVTVDDNPAADFDGDTRITIGDVTAIIDMLLNK